LQIVVIKGFGSGLGSLVIAIFAGGLTANIQYIAAALALGFVAYGLSIYFYILAQRNLGAARTSAFYAFAPFIGVALSFVVFREIPSAAFAIALIVMLLPWTFTPLLQSACTRTAPTGYRGTLNPSRQKGPEKSIKTTGLIPSRITRYFSNCCKKCCKLLFCCALKNKKALMRKAFGVAGAEGLELNVVDFLRITACLCVLAYQGFSLALR
jgi:hypothetical protein